MSQPFPDVWLPRDLEFLVDAQVAVGRFDVRWSVEYRDYRLAGREVEVPASDYETRERETVDARCQATRTRVSMSEPRVDRR